MRRARRLERGSADVRQLRRQSGATGRQVQSLAAELRQLRLQRRLREAVRREVARLQAAIPRRNGRRPAPAAPPAPRQHKASAKWRERPTSPTRNTAHADVIQHHVAFDETATNDVKEMPYGLETTEMEKDFLFEELCRDECAEMKLEAEKAGVPQPDDGTAQGSVPRANCNTQELRGCGNQSRVSTCCHGNRRGGACQDEVNISR